VIVRPCGLARIFRQLLVSSAWIAAAHCQTSRGIVTGTVLDPLGAAVRGANVALTSQQTGIRLTTGSNEAGLYRFDAVDLGVYDLQVVHPGFRTYVGTAIRVEANRVTTVDPRLVVGVAETRIEVSAQSSELLVKDSPLRGGNFQPREVRDLPLVSSNPLSLARVLPGVTEASGSQVWSNVASPGAGFAINGQRPRGNNYMLDGTENNSAYFSGEDQIFAIADAIEEVSVQTGNFGAEFGRAGGGVFNVVTKSGTNHLHGTLLWRYQSQRFESISNLDRLKGVPQSVFSNNVYGFTVGGPVRKNRTFFFAGFQENSLRSTQNYPLQVPTADAVSRLRSLLPGNPRLELYLSALGDFRGVGAPFDVQLGVDPRTGVDRRSVQFATGAYVLPSTNGGPQGLIRIDHHQSEAHRLSWRYSRDSQITLPAVVAFPGFVQENSASHQNFLFSDSYTFSPSSTNELRFAYTRPDSRSFVPWSGSVPLALTLPRINFPGASGISSFGLVSQNTQFLYGNSFIFQETQTKLSGHHAFRFGLEFLRQTVTEARGANDLGTTSFTDAAALGYSAFANFLDDFSGPAAGANRAFGVSVFHPTQLRQNYFFQDQWKLTPSLALTMGLRYENFGQPANVLPYPAFSGFDPAQFSVRREIKPDNKDFGPSFGLAWSPAARSGWLGKLFGNGKTVWRGGYQISYDAPFAQAIFLHAAQSSPNAITVSANSLTSGRGSPDWYGQLPTSATAPKLSDTRWTFDKDMRSPYTERWSFALQRQLLENMVVEVSYVGSVSHALTTKEDLNPRLPDSATRLYGTFGPTNVTTSQGNSAYHALQARLDRRFVHGFQLTAAYTWSKFLDSTSDGVADVNPQGMGGNFTSIPVFLGGLGLDRSVSDFDRPQRVTISYLWAVPGPRSGFWKYALGGWSIAGITTFQSGTPFTVANGSNRNGFGTKADRPDIGSLAAPVNSRAIIFRQCSTGYRNPDNGSCVNPTEVQWVQGIGSPNASTVGRNTLRTGGTNNFDLNLTKAIPLGEARRLELRWEALNAFNHTQFVNVPQMSVNGTPAGRFLNRDFTDSGIRSMWVQARLVF
jgi:Carboxypeptidase regulatory-like domain/TonB-dependent Receptor Plug Domain